MNAFDILSLIEQECELTKGANQIHKFTLYKINGSLVRYSEFLKLKTQAESWGVVNHVGIKYPITNDFWCMCLFTSQEYTNMVLDGKNALLFKNFNVSHAGCIGKYINPIFVVSNSFISEYATISNNINHFPVSFLNFSINPEIHVTRIIEDAINAFEHAALETKILENNNLLNTIIESFYILGDENTKIAKAKIFEELGIIDNAQEVLRNKQIDISVLEAEINHFKTQFSKCQNITGKSFKSSELFWENSERRFKEDPLTVENWRVIRWYY